MMGNVIGSYCDSATAIWRTWLIKEYPVVDLLDVAIGDWTKLGDVLPATVEARGSEPLYLSMPCRHYPVHVKVRRFSQREFFLDVDGIDLAKEERKWREENMRRTSERGATPATPDDSIYSPQSPSPAD